MEARVEGQRFRARYCHLEDGHATERVIDRLAVAR
jgi:hypothetical protein